eukprot:COSAG02_NODE_50124_length_322_cov_1.152466_1_plen_67_part_10
MKPFVHFLSHSTKIPKALLESLSTYKLRKHGNANAAIEDGNFSSRDLQVVPLNAQRKPIQHQMDKSL